MCVCVEGELARGCGSESLQCMIGIVVLVRHTARVGGCEERKVEVDLVESYNAWGGWRAVVWAMGAGERAGLMLPCSWVQPEMCS